jgi:hypothetical protein
LLHETPENWPKNKSLIEIDDFIIDESEIKTPKQKKLKIAPGTKIDANSKLLDFANLEVPLVDLKVKKDVGRIIGRVRNNLEKFKMLVE